MFWRTKSPTYIYGHEFIFLAKIITFIFSQTCGDRRILWSDRAKLPFVEATLLEIQRVANVGKLTKWPASREKGPLDISHSVDQDQPLYYVENTYT